MAIWEDSEVLYQVLEAYGARGGAVQAAVCVSHVRVAGHVHFRVQPTEGELIPQTLKLPLQNFYQLQFKVMALSSCLTVNTNE